MMKSSRFFAVLSALVGGLAHANINNVIHKQYVAPRVLGMGDAFVGYADDYNTLFYNPAGLGRLPEWQLNMFIGAGMDSQVYGFYQDVGSATKASDSTKQISELIANNYGNHFHFRAPQVGGIWAKPKWGFAFIPADVNMDIGVHQQVGPSLNVNGIADSTLALGYAENWKWSRSMLSIGFTLKTIYRVQYNQAVLAPQLATEKQIFRTENSREGMTVDGDLGLLYTPDVQSGWLSFMKHASPHLGLVVRNVGAYGWPIRTKFVNKAGGDNTPPDLHRVVDVGTSVGLGRWWVFRPRLALDHRNILHPNYNWVKGTHVGLDLPWKIRSWWRGAWRAGLNQGYWTAGFSGTAGIFTLDIATYGEEIGTLNARRENRRYMARASLDF